MIEIGVYATLIFLCLAAEAFFSGTETGMISLNRVRLRHQATEGDSRAAFLADVLDNPDTLLATTLVGTNLAVVTSTALATKLFSLLYPKETTILVSFIMIPIIVIGGELIPKAVFRRRPHEMLLPSVPLLKAALFVLSLPARAIGVVSRYLLNWYGGGEERSPFVTRDELVALIKAGASEGTLDPGQQRMLHGAFSFAGISLREAMMPLTSVQALPSTAKVSEVLERARKTEYFRFPVYEERIDQVTGVVNASDLLYENVDNEEPIADYIRSPLYLPNTVPIDSALIRMQRNQEPLAIVVDEYGGCDGIVTIQDIFEQVVGDLDSSRELAEEITVLSPGNFQLDAHIDLDVLNDELGLSLPKKGYETLAGFLLTRFQRIPNSGERLIYKNLQFEVLSLKGPTIETVNLRLRK